jgi:hypothetical protein
VGGGGEATVLYGSGREEDVPVCMASASCHCHGRVLVRGEQARCGSSVEPTGFSHRELQNMNRPSRSPRSHQKQRVHPNPAVVATRGARSGSIRDSSHENMDRVWLRCSVLEVRLDLHQAPATSLKRRPTTTNLTVTPTTSTADGCRFTPANHHTAHEQPSPLDGLPSHHFPTRACCVG